MSNPGENVTVIFVALLTACETCPQDLSEAPPAHQECAEQMRDAGILTEVQPGCFMLDTDGMKLLQLIENLRDYALGIS